MKYEDLATGYAGAFDDALDAFKQNHEDWRALLVLDDRAVRRIVLVWRPLVVRRVLDWPYGFTLADLWRCVDVDVPALADMSGMPEPEVRALLRQAQAAQVIWPDGTVPDSVVKMLTSRYQSIAGGV